jgi:RNA polymerase sigma-70 factor (ECF subfamily)
MSNEPATTAEPGRPISTGPCVSAEPSAGGSTERERIYYEILVLRCRRVDRGAFDELVGLWERRLFYYIRRLVGREEDAWDVLQETWLHAMRGIGRLREPRSLPKWLYCIARNAAMSRLRRRYADEARLAEPEMLGDLDAPVESFTLEDAEMVHAALERLTLPHRDVLTLHFLQDLSIEEIAEVLGVPSGTVKSRLHYAKRALRATLEQEGVRP